MTWVGRGRIGPCFTRTAGGSRAARQGGERGDPAVVPQPGRRRALDIGCEGSLESPGPFDLGHSVDDLLLALHQTSPRPGDWESNAQEIGKRVEATRDAHLVVFPELCLTGYALRSRVRDLAWHRGRTLVPGLPSDHPPLVLGVPEESPRHLFYNTAVLLHQGDILLRHRKIYLPTYGAFEEGRFFARGRKPPRTTTLPSGWSIGILLCEDFWHPALLYLLAVQGADLVVVPAAAPGRGDPEAGGAGREPPGGGFFASPAGWRLLARAAAFQYGIYLAVVNRVGVEEGLTFAGGSFVVGPDGGIVAEAPQCEEATLKVQLSRAALRRSRWPFFHLRDEDPDLLQRALTEFRKRGTIPQEE